LASGETIAKADGPAQRRRREAAQPDRRMRFLDRLWRHLDVLELEELALEGDGLSSKSAASYFEGLVGPRAAILERHTKSLELFPFEADAGADSNRPLEMTSTVAISSARRTGL
jgi:hypothetical protein